MNPLYGMDDHDTDEHHLPLKEQGKRLKGRYPALFWAVVLTWAVITLGFTILAVGYYKITHNRESIQVGCTLLNNAIVQSTQQSNQEATTILISEILEKMTPEERRRYAAVAGRQARTALKPIDCEQVIQNPESLEDLAKQQQRDEAARDSRRPK